jgi:hypothetical protein
MGIIVAMKTILLGLALPISLGAQSPDPARNFKVEKLAEGVYAVTRQDAVGFMVDANNMFIVNDNDVVLVDANGAPGITREVLAALRKCPAIGQCFMTILISRRCQRCSPRGRGKREKILAD